MSDKSTLEPAAPAATPLMQQYYALKSRHPDDFLLFRLGDFFELFEDDARRAAPILEVALTHRQQIPMCGVPAHALDVYVAKLLKAGSRVAIAEQTEEAGSGKGLVKREVIRVMTPGTLQEEALLPARQSNYLAALHIDSDGAGLGCIESSTGEFLVTQFQGPEAMGRLWDELFRLGPSEIVIAKMDPEPEWAAKLRRQGFHLTAVAATEFSSAMAGERLKTLFGTASLRGFGLEEGSHALSAAGAAARYLESTQCGRPLTLQTPRVYSLDDHLQIDANTLDHLDVAPTSGQATGRTLLESLDQTLTPMGGRLLRRWLLLPLRQVEAIRHRQDRVTYFLDHAVERRTLRALLTGWPDVERILTRLAAGTLLPRDLAHMGQGLQRLRKLEPLLAQAVASGVFAAIPAETGLAGLLEKALVEAPPATLKDGGVIRDGYDAELDEVRRWLTEGKSRLLDLEKREREQTGIPSLKIGFNNVFGYYLEVTKTHLAKVPAYYHRKQTTANGERYITPELKEFESRILGAEERMIRLEAALAQTLREQILDRIVSLRQMATAIAELDVWAALADLAQRRRYVRPTLDDGPVLSIREGRHPVLEDTLPAGTFVPNDVELDSQRRVLLLTGPNMSGKSTYLRQTALIVILAQMGSYVPAAQAHIGVIDQLFTRIGASDRLLEGESTFMVEMVETARILHHASARSLVILDEVGRGTSTYDGISIAWACVEHLHGRPEATQGPKVLFATHYFELTQLAQELPGVRNAHVTARESGDHVVFLHKIEDGPADRSYGIHVARLAGVPKPVIERASALLAQLEKGTIRLAGQKLQIQSELF